MNLFKNEIMNKKLRRERTLKKQFIKIILFLLSISFLKQN